MNELTLGQKSSFRDMLRSDYNLDVKKLENFISDEMTDKQYRYFHFLMFNKQSNKMIDILKEKYES